MINESSSNVGFTIIYLKALICIFNCMHYARQPTFSKSFDFLHKNSALANTTAKTNPAIKI